MLNKYIIVLFLFPLLLFSQDEPNDCDSAIAVCGDEPVSSDAIGTGDTYELDYNNVCDLGESNSVWLKIIIVKSGKLTFTITPNSSDIKEDYDFWVFGPSATCGSLPNPIRCSSSSPERTKASNNLTGLSTSESRTYETHTNPRFGDGFVKALSVKKDETYIILVNRFIGESTSGFSIEWGGTAVVGYGKINKNVSINIPCSDSLTVLEGFGSFDLESTKTSINSDLIHNSIAFFASPEDAKNGSPKIADTSSFKNTIPYNQTVYATVKSNSNDCSTTVPIELSVTPKPTVSPISLE